MASGIIGWTLLNSDHLKNLEVKREGPLPPVFGAGVSLRHTGDDHGVSISAEALPDLIELLTNIQDQIEREPKDGNRS